MVLKDRLGLAINPLTRPNDFAYNETILDQIGSPGPTAAPPSTFEVALSVGGPVLHNGYLVMFARRGFVAKVG